MFKSANPSSAAPAVAHVNLRTVSSCGGVNVTIPPSLRTIQPFLDDALKFLRLNYYFIYLYITIYFSSSKSTVERIFFRFRSFESDVYIVLS